jgi:hypothetical protein
MVAILYLLYARPWERPLSSSPVERAIQDSGKEAVTGSIYEERQDDAEYAQREKSLFEKIVDGLEKGELAAVEELKTYAGNNWLAHKEFHVAGSESYYGVIGRSQYYDGALDCDGTADCLIYSVENNKARLLVPPNELRYASWVTIGILDDGRLLYLAPQRDGGRDVFIAMTLKGARNALLVHQETALGWGEELVFQEINKQNASTTITIGYTPTEQAPEFEPSQLSFEGAVFGSLVTSTARDRLFTDEEWESYLLSKDRSKFRFSYLGADYEIDLVSRPPKLKTLRDRVAQYQGCEDEGFLGYVDRLAKGDKTAVVLIEECMDLKKYPFRKFPIPGTTSYFGYMGNGGSDDDSVWCQIDGEPQGCMLYKVENGKPTVLSAPHEPRDTGISIIQMELLKVLPSGDFLIHRFPYEICIFDTYENRDFARGISTGVVDYQDGGCAGATTSSLTFYPRGQPVELVVGGGSREGDRYATTTLSFNGESVGAVEITEMQAFFQGEHFPRGADLRAYALRSDKTKFYFATGEQKYMLDLVPAIPKLLKR